MGDLGGSSIGRKGIRFPGSLMGSLIRISSFRGDGSSTDASVKGLEDIGITGASEGAVVPLVYGKMKITGNIIWYGGLESMPIEEEEGGKGGGDAEETGGACNYYVDCWQAVCLGKVSLIKTYIEDNAEEIQASTVSWNDGTQTYYPYEPGRYANKLAGVAHIFMKKLFLGENNTSIPTIHFVVDRDLSHVPLSDVAIDWGANPAAVIYDLLLQAGLDDPTAIDVASFNAASAIYKGKKYGVNYVFTSQTKVEELINRVLEDVGGVLYIDDEGRYAMRAISEADIPKMALNENDFIDFSPERGTYADSNNDFRGNFEDENKNFSQRTVTVDNQAVIQLSGKKNVQTIDLNCFRHLEAASRRIYEIMKRSSYPRSRIEFSVNSKFEMLVVGDVVSISNAEIGLLTPFRIMEVEYPSSDESTVKFRAEEQIETLYDAEYVDGGGSEWEEIDTSLLYLTKIKVFELPYNSRTTDFPSFLLMPSREKSIETGYSVHYSTSGLDYTRIEVFNGWSQAGTLEADYPSSTYNIDDKIGILYSPYREDPVFQSVSRELLFAGGRVAIIGNEMLAFQNVVYEDDKVRMSGIIRGVLNTPIESHNSGSPIFISRIGNNVLQLPVSTPSSFYLKFLPLFGSKTLSISGATAIEVAYTKKAAIPSRVQRIEASRSGSIVTFTTWPVLRAGGAGYFSEETQLTPSEPPFSMTGTLGVNLEGTVTESLSSQFQLVFTGEKTVSVANKINDLVGPYSEILVGSQDGVYLG